MGMKNRASRITFEVLVLIMMLIAMDLDRGYGLVCDASACRSGVANDGCCKTIEQSIQKGTCSCICVSLSKWGYSSLPSKCSSTGRCKSCSVCSCQGSHHDQISNE
ncbi:hypothetical protein SUGI_0586590 [Cryptomeria japonica]|nr:hypothetical protein SUGI_0586590 [Cryptomeria japonica]